MQNRKQVEVVCAHCGNSFNKAESEVKRAEKKGMRHFCSRTCMGHSALSNVYGKGSWDHLPGYTRADEFTGFREYLRRAKARGKECNLTLPYLQRLWDAQNGKCPYSGAHLNHPSYRHRNDPICTASLDRIDSSKGYIEGNIQFISIAMNLMKSTMTDEQVRQLIQFIRSGW